MSSERKIDPEKIKVVSITTLKGNIESSEDIDQNLIAGHHFNFEIGTGYDVEQKLVGIKLVVKIDAIDENENILPVKGSYTHDVIMKVENLEDFIDQNKEKTPLEKDELRIDGLLGATLVGIAFSTIRGIIYIRTQGTSLGTVILPVVDPHKLISGLAK